MAQLNTAFPFTSRDNMLRTKSWTKRLFTQGNFRLHEYL